MRKATRLVAVFLGAAAGIAGVEHGVYEILQGNVRPEGLFIVSMGPPCIPEEVWNACEPALTVIPNFLITGILATLLGLAVLVWSVGFVHRERGGLLLVLLSIALLLFGGGLFPPLIGIIGGSAALFINKPIVNHEPGGFLRSTAVLWPWPLVVLMTWLWGQFLVGYFFNEFLQSVMGIGVILILALLPLSVIAAYAHDVNAALEGA
jgi:hypothetical protein